MDLGMVSFSNHIHKIRKVNFLRRAPSLQQAKLQTFLIGLVEGTIHGWNLHISWDKPWYPVDLPLNQAIEALDFATSGWTNFRIYLPELQSPAFPITWTQLHWRIRIPSWPSRFLVRCRRPLGSDLVSHRWAGFLLLRLPPLLFFFFVMPS